MNYEDNEITQPANVKHVSQRRYFIVVDVDVDNDVDADRYDAPC